MTRISTPLILVLALALGCSLGAQKPQVHWWRSTFDAAAKEAKLRNVPLLIVILQDGEEATERLIDGILSQKRFVEVTQSTIPIVCSKADHGSKKQVINGISREVCRRLGGCTCEEHQDLESRVFHEFFGGGEEVKTPQVILARPNLKVVSRILDVAGVRAYADAVKNCRKVMGPGLDEKTFKTARVHLTQGGNYLRMKQYKSAWEILEDLVQVGGPSVLVKNAVHLRQRIEEEAQELLLEARRRTSPWERLAALDQGRRAFAKTPLEERFAREIKVLSKTKEGRMAVRKLKKQKRYQPRFDKAMEHIRRGEYARARKALRFIRDRAKGLPLAEEASAHLERFKKDPAIAAILRAADQEEEAKALMKEARGKERAGDTEGARKIYQRIVDEYPRTKAARGARDKLKP